MYAGMSIWSDCTGYLRDNKSLLSFFGWQPTAVERKSHDSSRAIRPISAMWAG